mgnify:CR=1 FL=1
MEAKDWRDDLRPGDIIKGKNGKIRVVRVVYPSCTVAGRLNAVKVIKQKCFKTYQSSPYTHLDRWTLGTYVKLQVRSKLGTEIDEDISKTYGDYKFSCRDIAGIP